MRKKLIFISFMLLVLLISSSCSKEIQINTEYDSIQLEVGNVLNAGCYETDDATFFSHNPKDKHIYNFDYQNNIEHLKNENWVGYNVNDIQYVSSDFGLTFTESKELSTAIFKNNYRNFITEMLEYIDNSDKKDIVERESTTIFEAVFKDGEKVFNIVKELGTVPSSENLKEMETIVTVDDDNNINKIVFNIKSFSKVSNANSCYEITWNLSNYNETKIILPNFN